MVKVVSTGMVRRLDELGRVVIPRSLCKTLGVKAHDPFEILVEGENIILRKYQATCSICGEPGELTEFKEKRICKVCRDELKDK